MSSSRFRSKRLGIPSTPPYPNPSRTVHAYRFTYSFNEVVQNNDVMQIGIIAN
jgi:hypothetical protein